MIHLDKNLIEVNRFPDGTPRVIFPEIIRPKNSPLTIIWDYENDSELFIISCLNEYYTDAGFELILRMPYLPNARMDRVKDPGDVFTLKYFCKIINSMNFKRVEVFDVHSNVSLALIDRVKNISPKNYIKQAILLTAQEAKAFTNVAIFYPDEGAMKRYSDMFDIPFAYGIKKRDWKTGHIFGMTIENGENIVGKDVLIVDDICSRGGTFYLAAERLKEAGAKSASLYISHCENTIEEGSLFGNTFIKKIYTPEHMVHNPNVAKHLVYLERV